MWIEAHQQLRNHPKVMRLAQTLRITKAEAIGHLLLFWWWTMDYAPDGDVSQFTATELATAAEWKRDADTFSKALTDTTWVDPDGKVHDWHDYAGKLIIQRANDRERKKKERASRLKPPRPPDVHRTSNGCPPLPNSTGPNLTEGEARARSEANAKGLSTTQAPPVLAEKCRKTQLGPSERISAERELERGERELEKLRRKNRGDEWPREDLARAKVLKTRLEYLREKLGVVA